MISSANLNRLAAAIAGVVLLALPLCAQQPACTHRTTFVSVLDERGLPARGLAAGQFRAQLRGRPVQISSMQEDTLSRHVLLLLDTGESMHDMNSGKWQLALEVAAHVVENSPRNNDLKLAIFGKPGKLGARLDAGEPMAVPISFEDLSRGLPLIDRAIKRPPLFDALADGLRLLEKPRPGDVIFVVTDGGEESSKIKSADLEQQLLATGVRIFSVTTPMRYERSGLTVNAPAFSEQSENTDFLNLVTVSGGKSLRVLPKFFPNEWGFHFDDKERMALATSLQLLYLQMAHFYRLEFDLPQPLEKTAQFELDLLDSSGKPKKTFRLIYPRKLEPCSAPLGK
jgi:hypothetical protein